MGIVKERPEQAEFGEYASYKEFDGEMEMEIESVREITTPSGDKLVVVVYVFGF